MNLEELKSMSMGAIKGLYSFDPEYQVTKIALASTGRFTKIAKVSDSITLERFIEARLSNSDTWMMLNNPQPSEGFSWILAYVDNGEYVPPGKLNLDQLTRIVRQRILGFDPNQKAVDAYNNVPELDLAKLSQ